jgi:hypothetical protein
MKKNPILLPRILLSVLAVMVTECSPKRAAVAPVSSSPPPANTSMAQTFTDPFAYCAAVGTVNRPDAHYRGEPIPDEIINRFLIAAGWKASTEPIDMLRKTTIWRCMNNKVYVCNFGANLPCDSKANIDRTPSQSMEDYCQANRNSDMMPMSVTGHDTIYSWHCVKDYPQVLEQIGQVDAAGYLAQIWYAIVPSP